MPMSADVLGPLLKAAVDQAVATVPIAGADQRDAIFHAMATAIISHITSSAVVVVTSVSGVLAGPAASGPGAGTIT